MIKVEATRRRLWLLLWFSGLKPAASSDEFLDLHPSAFEPTTSIAAAAVSIRASRSISSRLCLPLRLSSPEDVEEAEPSLLRTRCKPPRYDDDSDSDDEDSSICCWALFSPAASALITVGRAAAAMFFERCVLMRLYALVSSNDLTTGRPLPTRKSWAKMIPSSNPKHPIGTLAMKSDALTAPRQLFAFRPVTDNIPKAFARTRLSLVSRFIQLKNNRTYLR